LADKIKLEREAKANYSKYISQGDNSSYNLFLSKKTSITERSLLSIKEFKQYLLFNIMLSIRGNCFLLIFIVTPVYPVTDSVVSFLFLSEPG